MKNSMVMFIFLCFQPELYFQKSELFVKAEI